MGLFTWMIFQTADDRDALLDLISPLQKSVPLEIPEVLTLQIVF